MLDPVVKLNPVGYDQKPPRNITEEILVHRSTWDGNQCLTIFQIND